MLAAALTGVIVDPSPGAAVGAGAVAGAGLAGALAGAWLAGAVADAWLDGAVAAAPGFAGGPDAVDESLGLGGVALTGVGDVPVGLDAPLVGDVEAPSLAAPFAPMDGVCDGVIAADPGSLTGAGGRADVDD